MYLAYTINFTHIIDSSDFSYKTANTCTSVLLNFISIEQPLNIKNT